MSGRGRSVRFRNSRDLTGSFERQRISEPHFLAASSGQKGFCLGSLADSGLILGHSRSTFSNGMSRPKPWHRRQRGTLLLCHQFWVDLVAGVRIAVHDDEVSQFLLLRVRQAVPGKPGRRELRLSAILRDDPR